MILSIYIFCFVQVYLNIKSLIYLIRDDILRSCPNVPFPVLQAIWFPLVTWKSWVSRLTGLIGFFLGVSSGKRHQIPSPVLVKTKKNKKFNTCNVRCCCNLTEIMLNVELTHYHTMLHFDTLKIYSCRKHCEKRRNCL